METKRRKRAVTQDRVCCNQKECRRDTSTQNHNHPASPAGFTNSSIFTRSKQWNSADVPSEGTLAEPNVKQWHEELALSHMYVWQEFFLCWNLKEQVWSFLSNWLRVRIRACELCKGSTAGTPNVTLKPPSCSQGPMSALPTHLTGHL